MKANSITGGKGKTPFKSMSKSELALLYQPHLTPGAAVRQLMKWIILIPGLEEELEKAGFSRRVRILTPTQVEIIIVRVGYPEMWDH